MARRCRANQEQTWITAISRAPTGMFKCRVFPWLRWCCPRRPPRPTPWRGRLKRDRGVCWPSYNTDEARVQKLAAGNAGIESGTKTWWFEAPPRPKMLVDGLWGGDFLMCLIHTSAPSVRCSASSSRLALTSVLANALMAFLGMVWRWLLLPVIATGGCRYPGFDYGSISTVVAGNLTCVTGACRCRSYYENIERPQVKAVTFTGFTTLAIGCRHLDILRPSSSRPKHLGYSLLDLHVPVGNIVPGGALAALPLWRRFLDFRFLRKKSLRE